MFTSLKFFLGQCVSIDRAAEDFVKFGYRNRTAVSAEGEFSLRGGIIDIFPVNFDSPVRIELEDEKICSIATIDLKTANIIWQHQIVIILPKKPLASSKTFTADTPLNSFVDIEKGDYVVHNQHGIGRFLGLQDFDIEKTAKEHLVIEYEGRGNPIKAVEESKNYLGRELEKL